MLLGLVIRFFLYSFLGALWEHFIMKKNSLCGDTIVRFFGLCLPFYFIYGFAGLLLEALACFIGNFWILLIVAVILCTVFECLAGQLSYLVNGFQTWNYGGCLCSGYISWKISLGWCALIAFFYLILYPVLLRFTNF